jgi:hypothetical protein
VLFTRQVKSGCCIPLLGSPDEIVTDITSPGNPLSANILLCNAQKYTRLA